MTKIILDLPNLTDTAALEAGHVVFKGKSTSPQSAGRGEYYPSKTGRTHHIHNEPGVAITAVKK